MATIKVYTQPGTSASAVGESVMGFGFWRNAVDGVNSDGTGIVFVDTDDVDTLVELLDSDNRVESYIV